MMTETKYLTVEDALHDTIQAGLSETNELPGSIRDGRVDTPLGTADAPGMSEGPAIVAVRPTGIRLTMNGPGPSGRITASRFLGDTDHIELVVEGIDVPLRVRAMAGLWPEGADVCVSFDPLQALVFPAGES